MHFLEIIKQQLFQKTVNYKEMYGVFFFQIEAVLSLKKKKEHGYPQFSFWIPKALAKFCFPRIVLNHAKISLY